MSLKVLHMDVLQFLKEEVLFERGKRGMFEGNFGSKFFTFELDDWVFNESSSREKLLKHFGPETHAGSTILTQGIFPSTPHDPQQATELLDELRHL